MLTEWNAMAAATLAEVASATGLDDYGRRAEEIVDFLWASAYSEGRLMRSWQGGRARHLAVGADYAWLADACARLSEWTGKALWRERALEAASQLVDLFSDDASGGFFTTGADAEALVVRPKEFIDGAVPATNSIAVAALLRANAFADDPAATRPRSGPSPWPGPSSTSTPRRSPIWWRRSPCGAGATRSW